MTYPSFIELPFATEHNAPPGVDNCDQYPESLVRYFLDHYTKKGNRVLDPFLGSGTTAIVAKRMGRNYIGVDTVKEYCQLARRNIAKINLPIKHTKYEGTKLIKSK